MTNSEYRDEFCRKFDYANDGRFGASLLSMLNDATAERDETIKGLCDAIEKLVNECGASPGGMAKYWDAVMSARKALEKAKETAWSIHRVRGKYTETQ